MVQKIVARADHVQPGIPRAAGETQSSAVVIDLGARRKAKARAAVRRYIEGAGASSVVAFPVERQVRPDLERKRLRIAA